MRFRAMIQDTSPSPEMYLAKRSGGRCGGWGIGDPDNATTSGQDRRESINYADLRECTVVWAVTIPGERSWAADALDGSTTTGKHATHHPSHPHKFPVPDASHVGVQIKVPPCSIFHCQNLTTQTSGL